jgi:hypothetical protein
VKGGGWSQVAWELTKAVDFLEAMIAPSAMFVSPPAVKKSGDEGLA